jgi:DNA-binding transcriptional regulator GbsR (MarR family)
MTGEPVPQRDEEAVRRFIERFASALVEAGVPPMPARVFTALLVTDSARLTAAELAALLGASPAAISSAVRYLELINMISRERAPGSRRDVYTVLDDVWYEVSVRRDQTLARWASATREGVAVLDPQTPAGQRMVEMLDFLEFLQRELPAVLTRWRAYQASRDKPARTRQPSAPVTPAARPPNRAQHPRSSS